ncbi:hypothetical protein [Roseateles sp. P5_E7]
MTHLNNVFFDKGANRAREGMSMIRPIELPKGTVIYRFYDSNRSRSPEEGMQGVWWLEFEYFQKVKHFAAQHGYSFSYAARLFAAILYEWSEVNSYVACQLNAPLHAWKGRGKQVESTGKDSRDLATMTPMQSVLEIYQLCVPGLDGAFSIAPRALQVTKSGAL